MRKFYYPLRPAKGKTYRKPKNVVTLYINSDINGCFIDAAYTSGDEHVSFEDPLEVAKFITTLPDRCWIITYNIDNWASLFNSLINTFDHITGVGKENHVLELEAGAGAWSVIDAFQYLACSLPDAIYKIVGPDLKFKDITTVEAAAFIYLIWAEVERIFEREFNCYPSKTPGASAMKIWRRFMPSEIFAKGSMISGVARAAIRPPALHWKPGIYDMAYMYDISASYPFVMANIRFPLRVKAFIKRPPQGSRWIATVKINYKCYGEFSPVSIPLLDGSHVNPTEIKNTRITLTYIDAVTLETTGEFEILQWIEGVTWGAEDEADLFSAWAAAIENASLDPKGKQVLKIVSRSLHSKFAQRPYYTFVEITRTSQQAIKGYIKKPGKVLEIYPLDDGELAAKLATRRRTGFKPFDRPDWEALIMAAARFRVYACIDPNTIYTHTDCIISTEPREDIPIGSAFGFWKAKDRGPAFIAGLGVYVIGEEVGKAGMKISDNKARGAIEEAAGGEVKVLQALCHPSLFSPVQAGPVNFTVQTLNYPRAVVRGQRAWVTRSPTRLVMIKSQRRLLSSGGRKKCHKPQQRR